MKLRSLLLASCMLVMPLLAMFSHWIPTEFRAATRRVFAAAMSGRLGESADAGTLPTPPAPRRPATAASPTGTALVPATIVPPSTATGLVPAATGLPPAAAGGPAASNALLPVGTPPAAAVEPAAPPLVAQMADRTRQVRDQQTRDRQEIEAQLQSIGAVSFDCQPLPGSEGLYSSSCRVPVDATGQLQRVFQASGHDPGSSSAALLEQVMAWRQRAATQPAPATAGEIGGTGLPSGERFR